ncbi:MAG: DUF4240 domain-containing protein [Lachnospiraceae bacterium]|nr:DUF4240 domain-containing protein [Ruminococcus sp.]MCM1274782.1 DUF4240 domain-containing protein [Lachnospiraceae bacterium]
MDKQRFFDDIMNICDWDSQGDDEKVLAPLIEHLSRLSDEEIFAFEDIMSELLYALDTEKNFKAALKYDELHSDDSFLYSRCVALINGADFYKKALNGKKNKILWSSEFKAILYVPSRAWAKKHNDDEDNYPHIPPLSYETGSNAAAWS